MVRGCHTRHEKLVRFGKTVRHVLDKIVALKYIFIKEIRSSNERGVEVFK